MATAERVTSPVKAYLSYGSNIHPRRFYMLAAEALLEQAGCVVLRKSSLYETAPWGFHADTPFYNGILEIETRLSAPALLAACHGVEEQLGRQRRGTGYASRTIDLDILLYGQDAVQEAGLTVPHPQMLARRFVLEPLCELIGEARNPHTGLRWLTHLAQCTDTGEVRRLMPRQAGRTRLYADGGSSSTKWAAVQDNKITLLRTPPLNPIYVTANQAYAQLQELSAHLELSDVASVHFYGAGCGPQQPGNVVEESIRRAMPQAEVHVDSDMVAAAKALWGQGTGITAIVGTGCSAGYYDGQQLTYLTPSVGFILGDESSGAWLGLHLLHDWLYSLLPDEVDNAMRTRLETLYGQKALREMRGMEPIVQSVYRQRFPNSYLAAFVPILSEHLDSPYCKALLTSGFKQFTDYFLKPLATMGCREVGYAGSVAWYFKQFAETACQEAGLSVCRLVREPLLWLVKELDEELSHDMAS